MLRRNDGRRAVVMFGRTRLPRYSFLTRSSDSTRSTTTHDTTWGYGLLSGFEPDGVNNGLPRVSLGDVPADFPTPTSIPPQLCELAVGGSPFKTRAPENGSRTRCSSRAGIRA
jgi:hypothetical protein